MRDQLLSFLQCIYCRHGDLQLKAISREGEQIIEGAMTCPSCGAVFPVVGGIPRMAETSAAEHEAFLKRHGFESRQAGQARLSDTARKTRAGFNAQLRSGHRVAPDAVIQALRESFEKRDHAIFFHATEMNAATGPAQLKGKVFLDVGCGGGQYSFDALSMGATVISLDMNDVGLTTYYNAYRDSPSQHAIQGSALRIPLKNECVDYAWSMGVLHHTDDLLLGFQEMARVLKIGGTQNVGVYYQYKNWPYYACLRKVTTRLPFFALWPVCHAVTCLSYLPRLAFLAHPWVEKSEPYRSRLTGAFDHFHPPIQGYYTQAEVASWYEELGCFADVHMTPVWNNFVGRKASALTKQFSESTRAAIMRC